jgi:hypothetical protein
MVWGIVSVLTPSRVLPRSLQNVMGGRFLLRQVFGLERAQLLNVLSKGENFGNLR